MNSASSHHSYCFAAPAYANSAPLAQFIPHVCPGASLILDHPAQLLNRLNDHRADAALMPVADLFANPDLVMIPGLGICADGLVRSVLLKCHRPLDRVTTVRWDPASRTSNALARLLMKHHWRRNVKFVALEECPDADAEVMIGDRALCEPPAQAGDYDLATAWKAFSGLPFVFAVWVHRKNHPHPEFLADIVNKAKEAGIQALPEIARQQSLKLGLSEDSCADYFTTCIRYDVGPEEREAMTLFRTIIRMEK